MRFEHIFAGLVLVTAAAVGASALAPESPPSVSAITPLVVSTTPLPLNRDDPAQGRIGALQFLGAVQIRATDPRFGGVSGLRAGKATADGVQMLGITDTGNWFAFTTVEKAGRLSGIANALLAPLPQPGGKLATRKRDVDAESVDWNPATGDALVTYEQDHRFVHFAHIDPAAPATLTTAPTRTDHLTQMVAWPANNGAEATAVLPDGTRIAIAESTLRADGSHLALITRGDTTTEIGIMGIPDHSPTDAIALDATTILVLHRRFSAMGGIGTGITRVDLAPALGATVPAKPLPAKILAQWSPPLTLDNMEGLALHRSAGRTFLYVVSDDNLNSLQRTILMKFELK